MIIGKIALEEIIYGVILCRAVRQIILPASEAEEQEGLMVK